MKRHYFVLEKYISKNTVCKIRFKKYKVTNIFQIWHLDAIMRKRVPFIIQNVSKTENPKYLTSNIFSLLMWFGLTEKKGNFVSNRGLKNGKYVEWRRQRISLDQNLVFPILSKHNLRCIRCILASEKLSYLE